MDAECSHDGSVIHLIKYATTWGWDKFQQNFMDNNCAKKLQVLQRQLLWNGFRLLKPGGTLIYSTCSFSPKQNEEIVLWLLEKMGDDAMHLEDIEVPLRKSEQTASAALSVETLDELAADRHERRPVLCKMYREIQGKSIRFFADYICDDENQKWWTSGFFITKLKKLK